MNKANRFIYFLMLIIGILGLLDTIVLLVYSNINSGTIVPGLLGLLLAGYAAFKLWICKEGPLIKNKLLRFTVISGIALLSLSFVLIEALILSGSDSDQNIKYDYLIILGSGVKGEKVSPTLEQRLNKGIEYLKQYPDTKVIVSGGKGFKESISEAEAMRTYLIKSGIKESHIIIEDKSTSTMENFKFSKKVLQKVEGKDLKKIMIITSDFHMMRSKALARRNGFEPYGITCATPSSVKLNSYIREYLAVIKSYIFDR